MARLTMRGVETQQETRLPALAGQRADAGRLWVLGLGVDRRSMDEVVECIVSWIDEARHSPDGSPVDDAGTLCAFHIVTLNPEIAMASRKDARLARVLAAADLVVPDGVGIVWAARWGGQPLPERVPGVDLLERFAARAVERGDRLFLLGGRPGVAAAAGEHLARSHPGLVIAGTHDGSPDARDDAETLRRVREARPDVLCVAYGAPAQEHWIARLRTQMGVPVAIGVGGALDMLAGRVPRAPRWMRRHGLEWLYRLLREPWRARRMLALPRFVWAVVWERADTSQGSKGRDVKRLPGGEDASTRESWGRSAGGAT